MSILTWLESIEFLFPGWLWMWPVLILFTLVIKQRTGYRIVSEVKEALLTSTSQQYVKVIHPLVFLLSKQKSATAHWSWSTMFLVWIILFLFIVALTQPTRIGKKIPEPPQERDIIFILDTSVSMLLRDYVFEEQRVDRMSLLKGLLDEFVQQLGGERIAVVIFGDTAYTYIPLTRDHGFIRKMLARIQTTMAGRFSAVGEAVALAVKQANQQPQRKRILVLFTAANQTTGTIAPQAAAVLASEANLPLYTVAIGAGSYQAEEKQRRGGLIYHPVDHVLLQQMASQTGARSYQGSDPSALKRAITDIDQRETNKAVTQPRYFREPLYQWPLGLALILLSLVPLIRLVNTASHD